MALRDQPYLALYVQDFMTDEKLIECSAASTGVYIRLLCIMHKNEPYGKILLKQKYKQTDKQIKNFALQVARQLPYSFDEILLSLTELVNENVLQIEGDLLVQKRMVRDAEISLVRSQSGRLGGVKSQKNRKNFAKAKIEANAQANTEIEIEYNTIDKVDNIDTNTTYSSAPKKQKSKAFIKPTIEEVIAFQKEVSGKTDPAQFIDHYEANGWKVGTTSMKNWKATYRNWERRSGNFQSPVTKNNTGKGVEPTNVYGELEMKMLAEMEVKMANLPPIPEY